MVYHLVPISRKQPASEERLNIVDLQLLCPTLELRNLDKYARRVLPVRVAVKLDLFLDNAAQKEGKEFFVIGGLMNVFSEALRTRWLVQVRIQAPKRKTYSF